MSVFIEFFVEVLVLRVGQVYVTQQASIYFPLIDRDHKVVAIVVDLQGHHYKENLSKVIIHL